MYISQLLPKSSASKAALLTSIIEPDVRNAGRSGEIITKKVALADRLLNKEYSQRAKRYYPNTPHITLTSNSDFYLTVNLEKTTRFDPKDLIRLPFHKRAKLLADVLKAVSSLSAVYGYFYLTESMLSYASEGEIIVWINEDYFSCKTQHPINHGRFSEEIFVADFKETFGGNFQEMKEFRRAKNMASLLKILNRGEDIYHSILMSEPITKESLIYREQTLKFSNVINPSSMENIFEEKQQWQFLKHAESSHNIFINMNRDAFEDEEVAKDSGKKLNRTLSSPSCIRMSTDSAKGSYGSLTSNNLPRINFIYSNKDAWKKKQSLDEEKEGDLLKSLKIKQDNEETSLRQSSKEFLKVSFPYTTAHSFSPIASFGSINLNTKQLQQAQTPLKELEPNLQLLGKECKMEQIGQMQMQFENLFESNIMSSQQQLQNLEVIMEQFQNILQG